VSFENQPCTRVHCLTEGRVAECYIVSKLKQRPRIRTSRGYQRVLSLENAFDAPSAADYLTKPFDQRELLARVKAVLRRTAEKAAAPTRSETRPVLRFADWRLDVARRELRSADNTLVLLSGGEFDLLLAFAEHPQRVLTRDQLIDFARGSSHMEYDRSIDVQVSRTRRIRC
jgi:DNA-binding response OmpR family regulator